MTRQTLTCSWVLLLSLVSASPARAEWAWPVRGEIITSYRNGDDPYAAGQHRGIDVAAAVGTPVVAAAAGEVRFAGVVGSSGLTVSVRTADGRFDSSYLHLSSASVRVGEQVLAGQRLGAVGIERAPLGRGAAPALRGARRRHSDLPRSARLPPATRVRARAPSRGAAAAGGGAGCAGLRARAGADRTACACREAPARDGRPSTSSRPATPGSHGAAAPRVGRTTPAAESPARPRRTPQPCLAGRGEYRRRACAAVAPALAATSRQR